MHHYGVLSAKSVNISGYEIWAKPQPGNTFAVLLMNNDGNKKQNVTVKFKDIPWEGSAIRSGADPQRLDLRH